MHNNEVACISQQKERGSTLTRPHNHAVLLQPIYISVSPIRPRTQGLVQEYRPSEVYLFLMDPVHWRAHLKLDAHMHTEARNVDVVELASNAT
jgi:hypothetical protein